MHQHVHHDVFGHTLGEVVDRDAHQRHNRQGEIGDDGVDPGAEIENDFELGKVAERARLRLPHRRISHKRWINRIVGNERDRAVGTHAGKPLAPAQRRPVLGAASDEQSKRALHTQKSPTSLRVASIAASASCGAGAASSIATPAAASRLNAASNSARV